MSFENIDELTDLIEHSPNNSSNWYGYVSLHGSNTTFNKLSDLNKNTTFTVPPNLYTIHIFYYSLCATGDEDHEEKNTRYINNI